MPLPVGRAARTGESLTALRSSSPARRYVDMMKIHSTPPGPTRVCIFPDIDWVVLRRYLRLSGHFSDVPLCVLAAPLDRSPHPTVRPVYCPVL